MKNGIIAFAKTKAQISFAVTAKLISAFVFASRIVQLLSFLNPKFQVSGHLLCQIVGNPEDWFPLVAAQLWCAVL